MSVPAKRSESSRPASQPPAPWASHFLPARARCSPREPDLAGRCTAWLPIRHLFLSVMPTRLCIRSLSLAPGSSSDCVSYAGFPGSAAAGMRLSESSNVAAPGRCAHHPGITPGGVICGDRDSPMNRGVRVASPRVPASTLISHRRGGVRGSSCAATSSARFARRRFHNRVLSAMAPGSFSRRTVSQRPATPGPARPCHRQPPAMPLSTRSSAPGLPWGSQSGAKGNGHARTKDIAARIRGTGGHPAYREYAKRVSGAR